MLDPDLCLKWGQERVAKRETAQSFLVLVYPQSCPLSTLPCPLSKHPMHLAQHQHKFKDKVQIPHGKAGMHLCVTAHLQHPESAQCSGNQLTTNPLLQLVMSVLCIVHRMYRNKGHEELILLQYLERTQLNWHWHLCFITESLKDTKRAHFSIRKVLTLLSLHILCGF